MTLCVAAWAIRLVWLAWQKAYFYSPASFSPKQFHSPKPKKILVPLSLSLAGLRISAPPCPPSQHPFFLYLLPIWASIMDPPEKTIPAASQPYVRFPVAHQQTQTLPPLFELPQTCGFVFLLGHQHELPFPLILLCCWYSPMVGRWCFFFFFFFLSSWRIILFFCATFWPNWKIFGRWFLFILVKKDLVPSPLLPGPALQVPDFFPLWKSINCLECAEITPA